MHFLIKFVDLKNLSIKQANIFKSEDAFPLRQTSNPYFFANVALLLFLKQLFSIINCICISKQLFRKLTVVRRDTRLWSLSFSNFKTNKKLGTSQQKMFITGKKRKALFD